MFSGELSVVTFDSSLRFMPVVAVACLTELTI